MLSRALSLSRLVNLAEAPSVAPVIRWSLVAIALCIVAVYFLLRLRRWLKEDPQGNPIGFTLGDLRALHRRGEMTDAEFEKAKAKIVQGTQAAAEKIKPPVPARGSVEEISARAEERRAESDKPSG